MVSPFQKQMEYQQTIKTTERLEATDFRKQSRKIPLKHINAADLLLANNISLTNWELVIASTCVYDISQLEQPISFRLPLMVISIVFGKD